MTGLDELVPLLFPVMGVVELFPPTTSVPFPVELVPFTTSVPFPLDELVPFTGMDELVPFTGMEELVELTGIELLLRLAQRLHELARMIPPNLVLIHSTIDSNWMLGLSMAKTSSPN
jgi:hypothetical protein